MELPAELFLWFDLSESLNIHVRKCFNTNLMTRLTEEIIEAVCLPIPRYLIEAINQRYCYVKCYVKYHSMKMITFLDLRH